MRRVPRSNKATLASWAVGAGSSALLILSLAGCGGSQTMPAGHGVEQAPSGGNTESAGTDHEGGGPDRVAPSHPPDGPSVSKTSPSESGGAPEGDGSVGSTKTPRQDCEAGTGGGCHVAALAIEQEIIAARRAETPPAGFDEDAARVEMESLYARGCELGEARSCFALATQLMLAVDRGASVDPQWVTELMRRACQLGEERGCQAIDW